MKFTALKNAILKYGLAVMALLLLPFACTEDELGRGRLAESHYVDLLYALHHDNPEDARTSARQLSEDLSTIRIRWYRPMEDEDADNMLFRMARAEGAFGEASRAIHEGGLELAAIQLDRAVYELSAADPVAFNQLYVASIYDFIATWLDVSYAIHDEELCSMEWKDFSRYGRDARSAWREVRWIRPSGKLYWFTQAETDEFRLAHQALDLAIDDFIEVVKDGDQCAAQQAASSVDTALWTLLLQFRSERPADPQTSF